MVSGCHARKPQAVQASGESRAVTVAGKLSDDLAPGTLNSILKQAGLKLRRETD